MPAGRAERESQGCGPKGTGGASAPDQEGFLEEAQMR